jgi:hypothetical protein
MAITRGMFRGNKAIAPPKDIKSLLKRGQGQGKAITEKLYIDGTK